MSTHQPLSDLPTWEDYLFATHSKEELLSWARQLHIFRFCRAHGGHASDGDQLRACFAVKSKDDLTSLLLTLGITPEIVDEHTLPPAGERWVSPRSYQSTVLIKGFEPLRQPWWTTIAGYPLFVYVENHRCFFDMQSAADRWTVDQTAVEQAKCVEKQLLKLDQEWIDPPQGDKFCICPQFYPDWFA